MNVICPKCQRVIPDVDVNVGMGGAFCRSCNSSHKLSKLARSVELDPAIDLSRPPAGTWFSGNEAGAVMGVSHRSLGTAFGLLALSLFWNGIVSMFVFFALNATLYLLHVPRPACFPKPIMNGQLMGGWSTLGLWLFLTPFMIIGAAFILGFLSALAGRTEVQLRPGEGILFVGIRKMGWRRRFSPELVKKVRIEDRSYRDGDGYWQERSEIVVETEERRKPIKFGAGMKPEQMRFVASALQRLLVRK